MEQINNPRRKHHSNIECVPVGYSNGSALIPGEILTSIEKYQMVEEAAEHFGKFLDALKVDWRNDPNSMETPYRVAKSYLDLWKGRYEPLPDITSFPSDGYDGLITETNIPLNSMCSHHHQNIIGKVHISYISAADGRIIGLSKLNRIVEHFGRRGQIQEQLTLAIHQAVDKVCEGNKGVAVQIVAEHQCVSCRGIKHRGSAMVTTKMSGNFMVLPEVRAEFFKAIEASNMNK
jgi:GTP cyclohydrolase I